MKSNIQQELIDSANQIREKYRQLKRGRFLEAEDRLQTFQPLIEPLQELKNIASKSSEKQIISFPQTQINLPRTPSK